MGNELTATTETHEVLLPYNLCSKEEKSDRRKVAVRLSLIMKLKKQDEALANNEKLMSIDEIATLVGVPRSNLFRWMGMEQADPGAGFTGYKTGPKEENIKESLSKAQKQELVKIISTDFPINHDIHRAVWDRPSVKILIKKKFDVDLSLNSISKLMHRLGLVMRRPEKYSARRNEEEIFRFTTRTYTFIDMLAIKYGAKIWFGDEMHVQQDSNHCSGYAPIGTASRILDYAETSSHRVCSIFSATSADGEMINTVEIETCDAEACVNFLKEIHRNTKGRVFLILDNARIHRSKKVMEYINSQRKISLFFLPAYAPDINPVELFNNAFKTNIRSLNAMKSEELINYVYKELKEMKKDKELMKSFYNGKKVKYTKVA